MANRKFGNLGSLGNLGDIILRFVISEFSIFSYSQNWKLGLKKLGKKFPMFPSFYLALSRPILRIWSHLLKKSLMENFIFCAVYIFRRTQRYIQNRFRHIQIHSELWTVLDIFRQIRSGKFGQANSTQIHVANSHGRFTCKFDTDSGKFTTDPGTFRHIKNYGQF